MSSVTTVRPPLPHVVVKQARNRARTPLAWLEAGYDVLDAHRWTPYQMHGSATGGNCSHGWMAKVFPNVSSPNSTMAELCFADYSSCDLPKVPARCPA